MDSKCELANYTFDEAEALNQLYSAFDVVAIVVIMPIILTVGVVGNLAFLLMVYRVPKMRSMTNFYLANLAISDIVFLLFGISAKIHAYRMSLVNISPVYNGVLSCLLKFFIVDLSYFSSLFMVTLVSLEKFYAICRPMQHRLVTRWARTVKLTAASWTVSLIFAAIIIPSYIGISFSCFVWPTGGKFDDLSDRFAYCYSTAPWTDQYANIMQTVPFFTTVVVNTTMYALIVQQLSRRVDQPLNHNLNAPFPHRAVKTRNQVAKMLVTNGIIFFLLLAPFEIVSVMLSFGKLAVRNPRLVTLQICRLLSYLNSAINPFIYGAVNARYRRAFRKALFQTRQRRVHVETSPRHPNCNRSRRDGNQETTNQSQWVSH